MSGGGGAMACILTGLAFLPGPNPSCESAVLMPELEEDEDPCPEISRKINDTINGVGMPGGKSLLMRVVEQIVGQGGDVYDKHEHEIEGYRNRLKNLRREWNDNDCGDPPHGIVPVR